MAAIKSIEEKAKAYDEAIKALRSLIAEQAIKHCDRVNIKDITNIFPELKESEDERIRENIIATIHLYYGEPLEDEAKEMIAWVEKQGEQILANSAKTCKDEQKPVIDIDIPFGAKDSKLQEVSYYIPEGFHAEIEDNKVIIKKGEQKPADNIESSTFKDKLLELFQRFRWYCKDKTPTNGEILEYVDAHIQELINTIQNNAWSEEDG